MPGTTLIRRGDPIISTRYPQPPLLASKLYLPQPSTDTVPRPHLIDRLNEGRRRQLTLVSAPAGFGKTTLISAWAARLERPVAWVSLDRSDSDPQQFFRYLIAALRTIAPEVGQATSALLRSPTPPPFDAIALYLVDEVTHNLDASLLVLDDYHFIDNAAVHQAVAFLVEHLPPSHHLVVATRVDPAFPLARLRVAHQLSELRASDLSFNADEIARFCNGVLKLELSNDALGVLESRTEGWIAGLQLAGISIKGQEDAAAFISSFAGDDHHIVDYLVEEVLHLQSEEVQRFLLHTSILDRLSAPLCDFVLRASNSVALLQRLQAANLFIIPLDNKRRWYRFHHLFADLLKQRFRHLHAEAYLEAHRRASQWHAQNGNAEAAITHALEAQQYDHASELISTFTETALASGGKSALSKWFRLLPEAHIDGDPALALFHAWVLFEQGQFEATEAKLRRIEHLVHPTAPETADSARADKINLKGKWAVIRSRMAAGYGDVAGILKYSQLALDHLPEDDHIWRANTSLSLGLAHTISGDLHAAMQAFSQAMAQSQKAHNDPLYLHAGYWLVARLKYAGQLKRAVALCRQLFAFVDERQIPAPVAGAGLFVNWGDVLYELNALDEALTNIGKGIDIADKSHEVAAKSWCYYCLMKCLHAKGDIPGVETVIAKAERLARDHDLPLWATNLAEAWRASYWLKQDQVDKALGWATDQDFALEGPGLRFFEPGHMVFARTLLVQQRFQEAERLIGNLLADQEKGGRVTSQIETLLIRVAASRMQDRQKAALTDLEKALLLAEPGGYVRLFVDEGPHIKALLTELIGSNTMIRRSYLNALLSACERHKFTPPKHGLEEMLSERELEVLRYIAAGLSNKKISAELFISLSTVKTHTRNIYAKLKVHSRTEAIVAAQKQKLL